MTLVHCMASPSSHPNDTNSLDLDPFTSLDYHQNGTIGKDSNTAELDTVQLDLDGLGSDRYSTPDNNASSPDTGTFFLFMETLEIHAIRSATVF